MRVTFTIEVVAEVPEMDPEGLTVDIQLDAIRFGCEHERHWGAIDGEAITYETVNVQKSE